MKSIHNCETIEYLSELKMSVLAWLYIHNALFIAIFGLKGAYNVLWSGSPRKICKKSVLESERLEFPASLMREYF